MITRDQSPNRATLVAAANAIEPLLGEVVFVGGQVAELLITDPGAVRVRPTTDVDVVVKTTTRGEYQKIAMRLRDLGLRNDMSEGAPICRWRTSGGHRLDVVPVDGSILGFSSQWYPIAFDTATPYDLTDGLVIHIPSAPAFLATKWDAFRGRGVADPLGSHDSRMSSRSWLDGRHSPRRWSPLQKSFDSG